MSANQQNTAKQDLVMSYKALRNFIGFSGILLPFILLTFTNQRQNDVVVYQGSISDYYYTNMGEVFVIVMCVTAIFLFTYKGHKNFTEKTLITLAATGALGLTLFPTGLKDAMPEKGVHLKNAEIIIHIYKNIELHWVFAAMFFICLSLISIFFFTKSDKQTSLIEKLQDRKLTQKSWRNIIYLSMGIVMLLCLVFLLLYFLVPRLQNMFNGKSVIFIVETIATVAFGISWITKGETLFPEGEHYVSAGIKALRQSK